MSDSGTGDKYKPVKGWGPRTFDDGKQTTTTYKGTPSEEDTCHPGACSDTCTPADPCFMEDAEQFFADLGGDGLDDEFEEETTDQEIERLLETYVDDDLNPSETSVNYAEGIKTITGVIRVMRENGAYETAELMEEMAKVGVEGTKFLKKVKQVTKEHKRLSRSRKKKRDDSGI
jgi:hypothetical protein